MYICAHKSTFFLGAIAINLGACLAGRRRGTGDLEGNKLCTTFLSEASEEVAVAAID